MKQYCSEKSSCARDAQQSLLGLPNFNKMSKVL